MNQDCISCYFRGKWRKDVSTGTLNNTSCTYSVTISLFKIMYLKIDKGNVAKYSVQFSSVAQSCPTLCDRMNCSTSGLPVHHQLLEFTQTHAHRVGDAIQPSHPLSSPFLPAPSFPMSQLFSWGGQSHCRWWLQPWN